MSSSQGNKLRKLLEGPQPQSLQLVFRPQTYHLPPSLSIQDSPRCGLAPLQVTPHVLVLVEDPGFHSPSPSQTMVATKSIYRQSQTSTSWTTWVYTSYSYQTKQSYFLLTVKTNAPSRMPTSWQEKFKVTGQKTTLKFNENLLL